MWNPYHILNIPVNATKQEIKKAELLAMKEKKFSMHDISNARIQLMTPAKRLCADFMFPSKLKSKRPKVISVNPVIKEFDLDTINENEFDSLK
jgi:hypothetical protein